MMSWNEMGVGGWEVYKGVHGTYLYKKGVIIVEWNILLLLYIKFQFQ